MQRSEPMTTYTINASHSGYYGVTSVNNTTVGSAVDLSNLFLGTFMQQGGDPFGYFLFTFRDFLSFDLSSIQGTISSISLTLPSYSYYSPDASEPIGVFDVTSTTSALLAGAPYGQTDISVYTDLGTGTSYGTGALPADSGAGPVTITLNGAALAAALANPGSFSVGLSLTEINHYLESGHLPGGQFFLVDENILLGSGALAFLTIETNSAPVAVADAYAVDEDVPLVVGAAGVLANDSDPDSDALTAALVTGPAHGTLALNSDGSFTYTPDANFHGIDSFSYRISDGTASSGETAVALTVNPINDAPVGLADSASVAEDASVTIDVLWNDGDIDGDQLSLALLSGARSTLGASIAIVDGKIVYTADADTFDLIGFSGAVDDFTYVATDGSLSTGPITVHVTVSPVAGDARTLDGTVKPDSFNDSAGFDTTYFADNGDDVVSGLDGSDTLHGGNGNDRLFGGAGIDFLFGDRGNDTLNGGGGNDYFNFSKSSGSDVVADFLVGTDHLVLDGLTVKSWSVLDHDQSGPLDAQLTFNEGGSAVFLGLGAVTDWHALL
jgi:VCBS repeat-containing protein